MDLHSSSLLFDLVVMLAPLGTESHGLFYVMKLDKTSAVYTLTFLQYVKAFVLYIPTQRNFV